MEYREYGNCPEVNDAAYKHQERCSGMVNRILEGEIAGRCVVWCVCGQVCKMQCVAGCVWWCGGV